MMKLSELPDGYYRVLVSSKTIKETKQETIRVSKTTIDILSKTWFALTESYSRKAADDAYILLEYTAL